MRSNLLHNEVMLNRELTLNCTTDAVPPAHLFKFTLNGNTLKNTSGVLKVNQVNTSHKGLYECTPYNILGAGEKATLNITVLGKKTSPSNNVSSNIIHK